MQVLWHFVGIGGDKTVLIGTIVKLKVRSYSRIREP